MLQCKCELNIGGNNMCLLNYNRVDKKYKHITYSERTMIETWYNRDKKSKKEIASLLHKSERTMRREINRGLVEVKGYCWEDLTEYSAQVAQEKYEYNKTAKGPKLKLDQDIKLVKHIETEIKNNKKSPEVISSQLKDYGFNVLISGKTIRNAIKSGGIFELEQKDMIYNKRYKNKNKEKRVSKMIPPEKSIEYRPEEVNKRSEYGHWEGDLVIGKQKGGGAVLFTMTERLTREEIIIKLKSKETKNIAEVFDKLERKYKTKFYKKFKTITFDNGVEFMGWEAIEKSCVREEKRVSVYYAHPYCSGERGTNENNNRMIRRWIPKGTDITKVTKKFIKEVENWINNYPRKMFKYKSSNMILLEYKKTYS